MKKVYRTTALTSATRQFISETLGIPVTELDLRRKGVTPDWLDLVYSLACIADATR